MTKIISTIIVLGVIVFLVFAVANKNKNTDLKTDVVDQTPSTATSSVNIPDGTYTASSTDAKINWTGRKVILKNWVDRGAIDLKEGSLVVENGVIISNKFVIDMTTIKPLTTGMGGNQDRLATHLKSDDFFNVALYPTSTFVAKEFTASTSNTYIVRGDLTIKGITKEISFPNTFY